jgi:hypothetical protein
MDDYFKKLGEGSLFHRAENKKGSLQISARGGEVDPRREKFNDIAREAERLAQIAGYRFEAHTSARDPDGWDKCVIYFE